MATPAGHAALGSRSLQASLYPSQGDWGHTGRAILRRLRAAPRGTIMNQDTKTRIIEATIATIKEEGMAGTSARAIARRGDFNQALIFYHFGSIEDLLHATMQYSSSARVELYRSRLEQVESLADLAAVARFVSDGLGDLGVEGL